MRLHSELTFCVRRYAVLIFPELGEHFDEAERPAIALGNKKTGYLLCSYWHTRIFVSACKNLPTKRTRIIFGDNFPKTHFDPRYVGARHLMKSSSMPPAVETTQSTILCSHRNRMVSRTPHEAMLLVYPKKMVALVFLRTSGSFNSSASSSLIGSSLERQGENRTCRDNGAKRPCSGMKQAPCIR